MSKTAKKKSEDEHEIPESPYSEAERNAMRAFLQRSEVRLSTLHRIATAFVGGAGLLLLVPIFVKDVFDGMLHILLGEAGFALDTPLGWVQMALIGYPLLLSLIVPLYALFLLLKDIVHFYFSLYGPGYPSTLLHPTFALYGITLPADDSPRLKRDIMRIQYQPGRAGFMMPFSPARRVEYFDALIADTDGAILPTTRSLEQLEALDALPPGTEAQDVEQFNAALGIARALDRTLAEEVAAQEMALVRGVLYLRRLVIRYAKALLMFIWTTIISFVMLPLLQDPRLPTLVVLSAGYLLWALLLMPILRTPVGWLYRHRRHDTTVEAKVDAQIIVMETTVRPFALAAIPIAGAALLLSLYLWLGG